MLLPVGHQSFQSLLARTLWWIATRSITGSATQKVCGVPRVRCTSLGTFSSEHRINCGRDVGPRIMVEFFVNRIKGPGQRDWKQARQPLRMADQTDDLSVSNLADVFSNITVVWTLTFCSFWRNLETVIAETVFWYVQSDVFILVPV